jgi:hypothetical protein
MLQRLPGVFDSLIALAGHQLRADDNLRASDILARVANEQGRLLLQGPTGGESDVVRDLLLSAYQRLVERDRSALAALSALPSRGISAESLRWVTAPVPAGEALGRIEGKRPPWQAAARPPVLGQ